MKFIFVGTAALQHFNLSPRKPGDMDLWVLGGLIDSPTSELIYVAPMHVRRLPMLEGV